MALADYINNKPTIVTDRLILRPMIAADVPALKEWMQIGRASCRERVSSPV